MHCLLHNVYIGYLATIALVALLYRTVFLGICMKLGIYKLSENVDSLVANYCSLHALNTQDIMHEVSCVCSYSWTIP